jgi:hypothetical protein
MSTASLGFTVKSGWASVVLLTGGSVSPKVADTRRIELSDPDIPDAKQPYHDGFGTARREGKELDKLVASVERFGGKSIGALIEQYRSDGHRLKGAGIVVGSLIDPNTLGNSHVRIHALEGQLFRGVLERAAAKAGVSCAVWRERDLYPLGVEKLDLPEKELRGTLATLGRGQPGSWRAEQKTATLAAWLVLKGTTRG